MIEDKIGTSIKQLVEVEKCIQHMEYMNNGITQPELLGAYHQQLHELRSDRTRLRDELCVLKMEHKRQLVNRLRKINQDIDLAHERREEEDLRHTAAEIEKLIARVEEEIKTYTA